MKQYIRKKRRPNDDFGIGTKQTKSQKGSMINDVTASLRRNNVSNQSPLKKKRNLGILTNGCRIPRKSYK